MCGIMADYDTVQNKIKNGYIFKVIRTVHSVQNVMTVAGIVLLTDTCCIYIGHCSYHVLSVIPTGTSKPFGHSYSRLVA